MSRSAFSLPRRGWILALACVWSACLPGAASAQAASRSFPRTALRGVLAFQQPPQVQLDGRPARLAPGVRIHGPDNMLRMSGQLIGQRAAVNYTVEATTGMLLEVWILTDAERKRQPWPVDPAQAAAWNFDPAAQIWTRP